MRCINFLVFCLLLFSIGCREKSILELNKSIAIDMQYPLIPIMTSFNNNSTNIIIAHKDIIESSIKIITVDTSGFIRNSEKLDSKFSGINFFNLYIHSLDSVFLFSPYENTIKLYNVEGELHNEFFMPQKYLATTNPDNPILFLNNSIILFNSSNSINVNTTNSRIEYYSKIKPIISIANLNTSAPNFLNIGSFPDSYIEKGRDFNDFFPKICLNSNNEIVFSYSYDNSIYVIGKDGKEQKYDCSSKHIKKFTPIPESKFSDMAYLKQYHMEQPRYTNIIYDRFHDVYLRVAAHKVEMDNMGHVKKSSWSIIVLDENFKKLGEILFDRKKYSNDIIIPKKEGVYIGKTPSFDKETQELILSLYKINN